MRNAIFDEIVCIDEHGVSHFNKLLHRRADPFFYAFDLLRLNGNDCRYLPLIDRKKQLAGLVESSHIPQLMYAQHIERYGKKLFEEVCRRDLEGLVAKRKLGTYKGSGRNWLKIKNRNYSQAEGRHELLTRSK